jgi:hypothetical protein
MKRHPWGILMSVVALLALTVASAKDDEPKIEGIITDLDSGALILTIADKTFWVDAKTKIENSNSVHIRFNSLEPGDFVELEYDPAQLNAKGYSYALKIEQKP